MSSDSISNPSKVRSYFRWSPEEEDELRRAVEKFGRKDWDLMRQSHDFPLLRFGGNCRLLKRVLALDGDA